jgi:hypothetical protein
MLGDMDNESEEAARARACQSEWGMKNLESLGVWEEGLDDLTGVQIHEKLDRIFPPRR